MNLLKNKNFQKGTSVVVALVLIGTISLVIYSNLKLDPPVIEQNSPPANDVKSPELLAQKVLADGLDTSSLEGLTFELVKAAYEKHKSGEHSLGDSEKIKKNYKAIKEKLELNKADVEEEPNTLEPKKTNQNLSQGISEGTSNSGKDEEETVKQNGKPNEQQGSPMTEAEYCKQKEIILQAIKAAITNYDEATFTTQLNVLNELRTKFKDTDNDQITAQKIASATPESVKTMLASLLRNDIINQHGALFKNPPKPFPEAKLKAIVAIRDALGLTTYDSVHFKTLKDYEAHAGAEALRISSEEYLKAKDVLVKALTVDVDTYNAAKFLTDLAEIVDLRTKFTDVDNDQTAAIRIPAATADATKTMLGAFLSAGITQKHKALFVVPLAVDAETKLSSILKIREELGLTTYGTKEYKSLDDYRILMRQEEFKKLIAALKVAGADKDATKKAFLEGVKNIGPVTPAGILSLPLNLALLEQEDSKISDSLIVQALASYFLSIHTIDHTFFVLDRGSPDFRLQEFVDVGKVFQANLPTEGEDKIREIIIRRIPIVMNNRLNGSFREKLSGLAIMKKLSEQSVSEKCHLESTLWLRSPLTLCEEDKEKPTYEAFKKVIDALFPTEKPPILGIFKEVISDEAGYKKQLGIEVSKDEVNHKSLTPGPTITDQVETAVTEITAKVTAAGLTPDADFTRHCLRESLFTNPTKDFVTVFLTTLELIESEIMRLKDRVEACLQKLDSMNFSTYLHALEKVYEKSGKPATEFTAFKDKVMVELRELAKNAIKSVSKENYEVLHFLISIKYRMNVEFNLVASGTHHKDLSIVERILKPSDARTPGNDALNKIVNALFYQALEAMRSKGSNDLEKEPLLTNLQAALRYYMNSNWTLRDVSIALETYAKTLPPSDSLRDVGLELRAKYDFLWSINFYISNAVRLTDQQITGTVLTEVTNISTALKGDYCFPRVLSGMSAKCIVTFWLVSGTTTADEFRNMSSVTKVKKAAVIARIKHLISAFRITHRSKPMQDALDAQIATIEKDL